MIQDRYGLSLSTSSAAAGRAYVEGVDGLLAARAAPEACFDRAIAADPDFALAHIGQARALQLLGRGALAQAAAARARALGAALDRRERQHGEALPLPGGGEGGPPPTPIPAPPGAVPRHRMGPAPAHGLY